MRHLISVCLSVIGATMSFVAVFLALEPRSDTTIAVARPDTVARPEAALQPRLAAFAMPPLAGSVAALHRARATLTAAAPPMPARTARVRPATSPKAAWVAPIVRRLPADPGPLMTPEEAAPVAVAASKPAVTPAVQTARSKAPFAPNQRSALGGPKPAK